MNYLNSSKLSVLLLLGIAAVSVAGYIGVGEEKSGAEVTGGPDNEVIRMEVSYGFDVKDEKKLVGFAENVFTGRVIEQVGSEDMPDPESAPGNSSIPQTQFAVEPLDNIKGTLEDTVTVNQQGGPIEQNGDEKKVLIEGDPLLDPGKEYMFVTRYEKDKDWHTIAAQPFGDIKVEDREKRKETKEKFKKAKRNQEDRSKDSPKRQSN